MGTLCKIAAKASRRWASLPLVGLALACHDASRSNPLDPTLTPAVELTVTADDTAGAVNLSWTPYAGRAAFSQYRVLRNLARYTVPETLYAASDVQDTSFVDRGRLPDTAYEYRVSVVNQAGLVATSAPCLVRAYSVQGVELLAADADSLTGLVRLRWTRYRGPGFSAYEVRRREPGSGGWDLLATRAAQSDTVFHDDQALHGTQYAYTVTVAAVDRSLPGTQVDGRLELPAVRLVRAEFASATASAELRWQAYYGPRFAGYRLERRLLGSDWTTVFRGPGLADTAWTDPRLLGNTAYSYRVVVTSSRGEEVPGPVATGQFHELLAVWPVPLVHGAVGALALTDLRFLGASGNELLAIASGNATLEMRAFDRRTGNQTRCWPLDGEDLGSVSAAGSVRADGRTLLAFPMESPAASGAAGVGLCQVTPEGRPLRREWPFIAAALPAPATPAQATVLGKVRVTGNDLDLDSLAVYARGRPMAQSGPMRLDPQGRDSVTYQDAAWQDPGVRLWVTRDCWFRGSGLTLELGGDTYSRYTMLMLWSSNTAVLRWRFTPPVGSSERPDSAEWVAPIDFLYPGYNEPSLAVVGGYVRATVGGPWAVVPSPGGRFWCSLADLGPIVALTADDAAYAVSATGQVLAQGRLPGGVTEARARPGRRGVEMALCVPERRKLLLGTVTTGQETNWWSNLTTDLGPAIGALEGFLSYPISVAIGPDGRYFVLDAERGNVVAFDRQPHFITRWGSRGAAAGEFDLGSGGKVRDGTFGFSGSILVDDEGFVYVADPGNQRIQKFGR